MPNLEEQIKIARQKLLDLSMRNRLLNYKSSKARTIRLVDENPREIYNILVLSRRAMDFRSRSGNKSISENEENKINQNGASRKAVPSLRVSAKSGSASGGKSLAPIKAKKSDS